MGIPKSQRPIPKLPTNANNPDPKDIDKCIVHDAERKKRVLRLLYPKATETQIRKMLRLSHEKKIEIPMPQTSSALDALFGAIIRHEETHYEAMLKCGISRQAARDIIRTRVKNTVKALKGVAIV